MKKLKIILDMDEVITDTFGSWLSLYNADYNDNLTREDIKGWGVHQWVKPECGHDVHDYLNLHGFFLNMDEIDGAIDGIKKLVDDGHDVIIASATPHISKMGYEEKKEWLIKNVPFLSIDNFASIHRKDRLIGDILFDDGVHNLVGFTGVSVAMVRPWNTDKEHAWKYERAFSSWKDFLKFVDLYSCDNALRYVLNDKREDRLLRQKKESEDK